MSSNGRCLTSLWNATRLTFHMSEKGPTTYFQRTLYNAPVSPYTHTISRFLEIIDHQDHFHVWQLRDWRPRHRYTNISQMSAQQKKWFQISWEFVCYTHWRLDVSNKNRIAAQQAPCYLSPASSKACLPILLLFRKVRHYVLIEACLM